MRSETRHVRSPFEYDALRRRVWIFGQRCHHGAAGTLVAGVSALLAPRRSRIPLTLAGSVLMVHDWKDRAIWFELGRGSQP